MARGAQPVTVTQQTGQPAGHAVPGFGPPPGTALLSRNENPYGPSEKAVAAGCSATAQGAFYADRSLLYLVDMIAEKNNIPRDFISVSAGSGEGLCAAAQSWTRDGGAIAAPALFWDTTVRYAERQGAKLVTAPMKSDLNVDLDALEKIVDDSVSLVHITNPNNPTGRLLDPDELRAFILKVEGRATVLVDEAYNELTDDPEGSSMLDIVRDGKNVIVSRTFSKIYGMAGLRVGYLMARTDLTARIRSNIMSWISGPGLAAAIASYNDEAFLSESRAKILEGREMVVEAAQSLGLTTLPSQTNFVFMDVKGDADAFRDEMKRRRIFIRGAYQGLPTWSRVSMGRLEDLKRYVAALPAALEG
ncbi:histidinol phosphate aminotransferase [Marinicaulis flavus]|uniref:Histidinol phosphate aminotransferase n=2 Tax=Hyphococcus luteus TaxID=2058213 RepID=A0A2S7K9U3_9PROT|nr:histidinol phosphate aminotransferase [Marinicaulis flavus]